MDAAAASTRQMNRIYRRQRHVYDLTRKFFLLGRDDLIARLDPAPGDGVLEIGCGTGRNLVLAARAYPHALLFGIDVSTEMLTTAIRQVERSGLDTRVRLAHGDATGFDPAPCFGRRNFQRVFLSYTVSMIPEWRAALSGATALLAPGGELHVVDFGRQQDLPLWFRSALRRWLALFEVHPRDDLEQALAACAAQHGATLSFEHRLRGYLQYARLRLPA